MSKIKINTNRKNISDEQALKHKSFDKVVAGYKAMSTPLYKTFKFWAGAGVAVTTVVVATLLLTNNLKKETESVVKPPFATLDVSSDLFSVDASKDTVITTKSGSQIKIAANSFVDENGNPLNGIVDIKYREFHDVIDIFMSGIPMTYDSAGTQYHFESAGMFEIKGFQNQEEVFISNASPITVLLASKQEGERFNIYKLDDKNGDWSYLGKDTAGKLTSEQNGHKLFKQMCSTCHSLDDKRLTAPGLAGVFGRVPQPAEEWLIKWIKNNQELRATGEPYANKVFEDNGQVPQPLFTSLSDDEIKSILNYIKNNSEQNSASPLIGKLEKEVEKAKAKTEQAIREKPVEPKKLAEKSQNLKIEVEEKEFPELALYKNLLFEIDKNDKTYKPELAKITWDAASVKKGKESGTYILTFTKGKDDYSFLTRPVVSEKDFPKAKEVYERKFVEYEKTLEKRKEDEAKKQKELEEEYARLNAEREAQILETKKRIAAETGRIIASGQTREIIYRSCMVSSFGIWNSDCPQNMPKGLIVSATFSDKNNKAVAMQSLFLVEKGKNAVYSYYSYDRFQFNPNVENILLGVTTDNKIAIFKAEDFAALGKIGSSCNFKMDVLQKKFENMDDVKAFIGI